MVQKRRLGRSRLHNLPLSFQVVAWTQQMTCPRIDEISTRLAWQQRHFATSQHRVVPATNVYVRNDSVSVLRTTLS